MNKKIKVIDLLNKIAKDESYRPTVKYQEMTYTYQWDIGDYTNDFNSEYGIFSGWALNLMLNNEVEILEDNTEDIEELEIDDNGFIHTAKGAWKGRKMDIVFAESLNQLAKAVKQLDKKIKEK